MLQTGFHQGGSLQITPTCSASYGVTEVTFPDGNRGRVQLLGLENTVNHEEETNNGIVTKKPKN